jgi:regulatory protein
MSTGPRNAPAFSPSLKGRALRLLSNREHSRKELERKLAPHEETPGELREALDELQAKGFISDERAAESVLHRRASRLGLGRLKQELQAKGLDAALVTEALAPLKETEFARAREAWFRRYGGEVPRDAAERARQSRFLAARGFGGEVIRKVLAGGAGEDD